MYPVETPFKVYTGLDGKPLNNGYVYFGVANQNPITSPVTVYWDAAGTQPAAQPLRTENGYIMRAGTPANVFYGSAYSELVQDSRRRQVFYARTSDDFSIVAALLAFIASLALSTGASLIGWLQSGAGAILRTIQDKLRDTVSVKDFGALGNGTDESAKAALMIAAHNRLHIPAGFTLTAKNIELFDNTQVICEGILKLPAACADFDRLLYANTKSNITIKINEIDGNYAAQVGQIGTHLVYLRNCEGVKLDVKYAHDHYTGSGAPMPSVDGTRDASSGAILLYRCHKANVNIELLSGWSREGVYLQECNYASVDLGHAQGVYETEYSGLQVKGDYNRVVRASVDFAGASGVGFDTRYGTLSNVVSTNTRENHGVNFGHTGFPATGSVANNIIVDGAFGYGITVAANSEDVSISNFNVSNAGEYGISFSDGADRGKITSGMVGNCALGSLNASVSQVQTSNVLSSDVGDKALKITSIAGLFSEGETITTAGGSATVRRVVRNLAGALQIVFLSGITGVFTAAEVATGGTSGATGTITLVSTPVQRLEALGGLFEDETRYFSGTVNQVRFPDGTALFVCSVACNHTTAGTPQDFVQAFSSNVAWDSAPYVVASVSSANSTGAYVISRLGASATTTNITITINASVNQIYGITVFGIGRWKA